MRKKKTTLIILIISLLLIISCSEDKTTNSNGDNGLNYEEQIIGSWELLSWTESGETYLELDSDEKYFYFLEDGTFISLERKSDGSYENECYAGGGNGGSYTITESIIIQQCGDQWNPTMNYLFSNENNTLTMNFNFGNLVDHQIVAERDSNAPDYHDYLP